MELLAGKFCHRELRFILSLIFMLLCNLSYFSCSRMVMQQNERFSQMEEKYKSLQGKTSSLFEMEEEVLRVSRKVRSICRPVATSP